VLQIQPMVSRVLLIACHKRTVRLGQCNKVDYGVLVDKYHGVVDLATSCGMQDIQMEYGATQAPQSITPPLCYHRRNCELTLVSTVTIAPQVVDIERYSITDVIAGCTHVPNWHGNSQRSKACS
jgi:hypothetical protein